jgi:outer membrane protein W
MKKFSSLCFAFGMLIVVCQAQSIGMGDEARGRERGAGAGRIGVKKDIGLGMPVQKGNVMLGMNVAPSAGAGSDGNGVKSFYKIATQPKVGYFLTDKIAVGLSANGTFAHNTGYHCESYGGGGFARYYFSTMTREDGAMRRARFFVEGGASLNAGAAYYKNPDGTEDKVSFSNVTPYVMPGMNYFFSRRLACEAGLQLNHVKYSHFGGRNMQDVTYVAPVVGLHYFIIRDKKKAVGGAPAEGIKGK